MNDLKKLCERVLAPQGADCSDAEDLAKIVLMLGEALENLSDISRQVFNRWVNQKSGMAIFMNSMNDKTKAATEALAKANSIAKESGGMSDDKSLLADGVEIAIEECKRRLAYVESSDWLPAYEQALKDIIVILEPMAMRLRKGEYMHPVTSVHGEFVE